MKIPFKECLIALTISTSLFAQVTTVRGKIVESNGMAPVPNVTVQIANSNVTTISDALGLFTALGSELPLGEQVLVVSKLGYVTRQIRIIIQHNKTINLDPLLFELDLSEIESHIGVISLSDAELDNDDGSSFAISGLLQASRDVFLNAAAFDFSATFFRPRGLDNAYGKVLINGIEMNKVYTGRPQWANWGGLNDAQRNREFTRATKANDYTFGDVAGTTNIIMRASQYRKGGRVSYASANRSYLGRIMGSYNSGLLANGWAYSFLVSRRYGEEGFIEGTPYDANSFFVSVEKKLNEAHSVNLTAIYTPNRRGRASPLTQEVFDLKGNKYNPNWGFQNGKMRNSRIREIQEPLVMLNHYWSITPSFSINSNIGFQMGSIGNSRIDNGGTRLVVVEGEESFLGGARNPYANYYQRLPSFFLQETNPTSIDYQLAYAAEKEFLRDGQLDWQELYSANTNLVNQANGGNSIYALQEDVIEDSQFSINSIVRTTLSENTILNGTISYRKLHSQNYAQIIDLLGGSGYLDIDFFAEEGIDGIVGDKAQSDLRNRNRIVQKGERYKYNYDLNADKLSGFVQVQFVYHKIDFYLAAIAAQTSYQRVGLYENGNFPGLLSFGNSEKLNFTTYGAKGGLTYKVTGKHLIDVNASYHTKAPNLRNSFPNARQNNSVTSSIGAEVIQNADASYIFRSPWVKARITGFYNTIENETDVNFFFTQSAQGKNDGNAFVQEVLTGINTNRFGGELGIEALPIPTFKIKAAASVGQYRYTNNPKLYLTSDDFKNPLFFGDGTTKLANYHVAGGPERAYQLGFEYRDPEFWWVGVTTNYFSKAYIDVSSLRRSDAFNLDQDGQPFVDYDFDVARKLLAQEELDAYFLVNLVGGKSWRLKGYYIGFFASVNNVLNQEYTTGGFESSRYADYRKVLEDQNRTTPIFGSRYFFGNGTTYYVNAYIRF